MLCDNDTKYYSNNIRNPANLLTIQIQTVFGRSFSSLRCMQVLVPGVFCQASHYTPHDSWHDLFWQPFSYVNPKHWVLNTKFCCSSFVCMKDTRRALFCENVDKVVFVLIQKIQNFRNSST